MKEWSRHLAVLWAKSDAGGTVNLLVQHLLDTAAVAELLWDGYLAPGVRNQLRAACGEHTRDFVVLLSGLHDVGKASPAFQVKAPELAAKVQDAGLTWRTLDAASLRWHHSRAGAVILKRVMADTGWDRSAINWVWPLVAGHHGIVPGGRVLMRPPGRGNAQGIGDWETVQNEVVSFVADELSLDLNAVAPTGAPTRAQQLALSGMIIMADWIASDERHFPGVDDIDGVCIELARRRAAVAWAKLGLKGGWSTGLLELQQDPIFTRFEMKGRPAQLGAVDLAEQMPAPGLLIVEAPMGEGKTEAAFAVAEVLARRFGADGVFVGMPTQATSDPMFTKVRSWIAEIEPGIPVGLLHGKRQFNREWVALRQQMHFTGVDEYGCDDNFGIHDTAASPTTGETPAEWFLGRKRGLLAPLTVGTVDQLLRAATRTRHVMLPYAGLAGRVVILDEVHAYDVYMAQFLFEALRWLADAGVPVVVLSATLPPAMRAGIVRAYVQGGLGQRDVDITDLPAASGYPAVLSVSVDNRRPAYQQWSGKAWRPSQTIAVEVLDEPPECADEPLVDLLAEALDDGGCALVVRNTVKRAQDTYAALRALYRADVVLLHGRLTVGERTDRAEKVLRLLGPSGEGNGSRPARLIVVATQLAEQSFDVDVDLLISDLAPIDLLLQRVGRLHRHARAEDARPPRLRDPRLVVTGMASAGEAPPSFPRGSSAVYGDHLLLRTAVLVEEAVRGGWSVPADVPWLVARGYGDEELVPESWAVAAKIAYEEWRSAQVLRRANAEPFLLSGPDDLGAPTLDGLHEGSTADLDDDDRVAAVVRDGDPSVEVILVRRDEREYLTLGGRSLGINGEAVSDDAVLQDVARACVRLPARRGLTEAALDLRPLPGWGGNDPWLRHARALVLDDQRSAHLGGFSLAYDDELGLIDKREGTH